MDTRVPADEGGWRSPAPPGAAGDALQRGALERGALERGALEHRLAAIENRLESLERTMRETVTEELHSAGDELRRAVSDLGRLLLRDLDRLTKVLADHRDAIVERLSVAAVAADAPAPVEPAAVVGEAPEASAPAPAASSARGEEGRWRATPGRRKGRRSPKAGPGGDTQDG